MRGKTKKPKIFLGFVLLSILFGCTVEQEVIEKNANSSTITMTSKKFEELLQLPAFNTAYQKVVKRKGAISNATMARTALEDQYGFTISTDIPVKVVTDSENGTTYVMFIERPEKEALKFENLQILIKDSITEAIIIKYDLLNAIQKTEAHDSFTLNIKEMSVQPIEIDGKIMYNNNDFGTNPCTTTHTLMCTQPGDGWDDYHVATQYCLACANDNFPFVLQEETVCIYPIEGGGSTPSNINNGTGGGSNGGANPPHPIINYPVICSGCPELDEQQTPCEKISEKTADNSSANGLVPKLQNLRLHVNGTKEYGISLEYKKSLNQYTSTPVSPQTQDGNNHVTLHMGEYFYGGAHNHTNDGSSIPSWDDLRWLFNCYSLATPHNQTQIITFIVVENKASLTPATFTYALIIDNPTLLQQKIEADLNSITSSIDLDKKIKKILEAESYYYGLDFQNNEKNFLLKYGGYGFSIFKANNDTLNNWSQLNLNSNNDVVAIPCPQN